MIKIGKKKNLPGRDPVKRDEILTNLCSAIASGKWLPGDRIPDRKELLAQFGVSIVTLQNAIEILLCDGFLVSERGRGTFVAERPPCTHRFAVISTKEDMPNRFQKNLLQSAKKLGKERGFEIFSASLNLYDMQLNPGEINSILDQIDRHLFAGILMIPYFPKEEIPTHARAAGIPLARFHAETGWLLPPSDIVFDLKLMEPADLFVKVFQENNVKKVSILCWNEPGFGTSGLVDRLASAGIVVRPEWILSIPPKWQTTGPNIIRLLLSLPDGLRPDGIFVADDNLLPLVLAEAEALNIRIPEDLFVAVQYNFPEEGGRFPRIWKIGPDTDEIVKAFFECSKQVRETGIPQTRTIGIHTSNEKEEKRKI